jgi:hypothetical protein
MLHRQQRILVNWSLVLVIVFGVYMLGSTAEAARKIKVSTVRQAYESGAYSDAVDLGRRALRQGRNFSEIQAIKVLLDDASFELAKSEHTVAAYVRYRSRFKKGGHLAVAIESECLLRYLQKPTTPTTNWINEWLLVCKGTEHFPAVSALKGSISTAQQAASEQELTPVVVTGMGVTVEEATKNAWTEAIATVVGSLVDQETIISNETVIKDQVLSASAGMIEDYEILGTSIDNGLVQVEMRAVVRKTQLSQTLRNHDMVTTSIGGTAVHARLVSERKKADDARAFFMEAIEPFLDASLVSVTARSEEPILAPGGQGFRQEVLVGLEFNREAYRSETIKLKGFLEQQAIAVDDIFCNLPKHGETFTECYGTPWDPQSENIFVDVYNVAPRESKKIRGVRYTLPPGYFNPETIQNSDYAARRAMQLKIQLTKDRGGLDVRGEKSLHFGVVIDHNGERRVLEGLAVGELQKPIMPSGMFVDSAWRGGVPTKTHGLIIHGLFTQGRAGRVLMQGKRSTADYAFNVAPEVLLWVVEFEFSAEEARHINYTTTKKRIVKAR